MECSFVQGCLHYHLCWKMLVLVVKAREVLDPWKNKSITLELNALKDKGIN